MDKSDTKTVTTKTWKENIQKLLLNNQSCGICLEEQEELHHLDAIFFIKNMKTERSLQDIIDFVFGSSLKDYLPSKNICETCTDVILQSYFLVKRIKTNHFYLDKYFSAIYQNVSLPVDSDDKQLMLTIDNINTLKVPSTVTKSQTKEIMQIIISEVNQEFDVDVKYDRNIYRYECSYCGKKFDTYDSFKKHFALHKDAYYRCPQCGKRVKSFKEMIKHRNVVHEEELRACDICRIILLSKFSIEHEREHKVDLICHLCQIAFPDKSTLDNHIVQNHSYVKCNRCFKTFNNELKLNQHRCAYKCSECSDGCKHEYYLNSYREQRLRNQVIYKCPDCSYKYTVKNEIITHANLEHLKNLPFLCHLCGENFAARPMLSTHYTKMHSDNYNGSNPEDLKEPVKSSDKDPKLQVTSFKCNTCSHQFQSKKALSVHEKRHLVNETQCQYCGSSFFTVGLLNTHLEKFHPNELNCNRIAVYRCTMCPLDFNFRNNFVEHVSSHPAGSKHVCRECNATFSVKQQYLSHLRKHRIKYDRECPICFKKYTRNTIQRHMAKHAEREEFENPGIHKCKLCGKTFSRKMCLIKHSKQHEEKEQCPCCHKEVNSILLKQHLKTHDTTNNVKSCTECDYTTRFSNCLEAHVNRYHLKIRPYKCSICSKSFYSVYTLKDHKVTHKMRRQAFYCIICGNQFVSKKAVILHTRLHTGETPYPCKLCDMRFISGSRLHEHMVRKHFAPSVQCQYCDKKLFTRCELKRHLRNAHSDAKTSTCETDLIEQEVEEEVISNEGSVKSGD